MSNFQSSVTCDEVRFLRRFSALSRIQTTNKKKRKEKVKVREKKKKSTLRLSSWFHTAISPIGNKNQ